MGAPRARWENIDSGYLEFIFYCPGRAGRARDAAPSTRFQHTPEADLHPSCCWTSLGPGVLLEARPSSQHAPPVPTSPVQDPRHSKVQWGPPQGPGRPTLQGGRPLPPGGLPKVIWTIAAPPRALPSLNPAARGRAGMGFWGPRGSPTSAQLLPEGPGCSPLSNPFPSPAQPASGITMSNSLQLYGL